MKIKDIFPKTKGIFLKIRVIFQNTSNQLIYRPFYIFKINKKIGIRGIHS